MNELKTSAQQLHHDPQISETEWRMMMAPKQRGVEAEPLDKLRGKASPSLEENWITLHPLSQGSVRSHATQSAHSSAGGACAAEPWP